MNFDFELFATIFLAIIAARFVIHLFKLFLDSLNKLITAPIVLPPNVNKDRRLQDIEKDIERYGIELKYTEKD